MTWAVMNAEHLAAVREIESSPSDRILAIVGGAILDTTLARTIAERLKKHKDIRGKLFRPTGALGNTEPKVDLLFLMNGIDKPVRNAMYGLIQLRNHFAHVIGASLDTKTEKLDEARGLLTLHQGRRFYPHHLYNQESETEIESISSNRELFRVNLKLVLIALMKDRVSHELWSNTPLSEADLRKSLEPQSA